MQCIKKNVGIIISSSYRNISQNSCSMFKKLVSMLAAVAVFRNYVLGNIAAKQIRRYVSRAPTHRDRSPTAQRRLSDLIESLYLLRA